MPVGEHDDLAVVAHLEQLLDAAVHVADDGLAGDDPFAVERQPEPQHAVGRRMLRTDVEDHVLGGELAVRPGTAALVAGEAGRARAQPDDPLLGRTHVVMLP